MRSLSFLVSLLCSLSLGGCSSGANDNAHTTATTIIKPNPTQVLNIVSRPATIVEMMKARGAQDEAMPIVTILSPALNSIVNGPIVPVRMSLSGDLKGYHLYRDPISGTGNNLHVILDNEPYEVCFDIDQPILLQKVASGKHTLRVIASRPWHESYKNPGAFQMISFTVAGETPRSGANTGIVNEVDPAKPLLTYSRPQGEYKGDEADPIMIDFWVSNAKLKDSGGEYRIRYFIDDDDPRYIDEWAPVWLKNWTSRKHIVRLELLGADQYPVQNAGYDIVNREISVIR
jgi:hypothetical protein